MPDIRLQHFCESRKIGVFAGVMNCTYMLQPRSWSVANRISYLLNFQGPSMAVDTAFSSSLTAIYLAMESLYSGMSECAIAGGVSLILNPVHYLGLSEMTMLSSTRQCRSFGDHADGFVDGEGVGAIVLKPLEKAIADKDHIYGILKGGMLNAGGKTNGYTVPNPNAQFQLILEALKQAGIQASTVSYMETHGTATALGDPIEISGLARAFEQDSKNKQFCAIGSVKSNIGHCESAAGIAGVTKVLLQLKHGQLAPSLHSKALNPNIDFLNTPFLVQQKLEKWKRPRLRIEGETKEYPRIAGVSSFGAGGSNAHLLIEEYVKAENMQLETGNRQSATNFPCLIVLSAKNEDRLSEYAGRLLAFIQVSAEYKILLQPECTDAREPCTLDKMPDVLEKKIRMLLAELLQVDETEIEADEEFEDYGVLPIHQSRLLDKLQEEFNIEIDYREFMNKNSVALASRFISRSHARSAREQRGNERRTMVRLADIAYTLQVGREAMETRLGFIAKSLKELEEKLEGFLNGQKNSDQKDSDDFYFGRVSQNNDTLALFTADEDMGKTIDAWISKRKYSKLLKFWVQGLQFDWNKLYGNSEPSRISLPTYPFAKESYWAPEIGNKTTRGIQKNVTMRYVHPIANQNISESRDKASSAEAFDILMWQPVWKEIKVAGETRPSEYSQHLVMLCSLESLSAEAIEIQLKGVSCMELQSREKTLEKRYQDISIQVFQTIKDLLEKKTRGKILVQILISSKGEGRLFSGLSGLLKTAHLENPKIMGQIIEAEPGETKEELIEKLMQNSRFPEFHRIMYKKGQPYAAFLEEIPTAEEPVQIPWKNNGIYLITGGAGGLGLIFAREIAEKTKHVLVILTGRSRLSREKQDRLDELEALGARIEYHQADISQQKEAADLIQGIRKNFGPLNGIIHSAGIIRDNFILRKTEAEFSAVLAPKVAGTVNLDQATRDINLDFLILFSSIAGVWGNPGQADYSTANAFMDVYAQYRNHLATSGKRRGQTLSVNWPLWKEGGMRMDSEKEKTMKQNMGMMPMETSAGIRALHRGLASGQSRIVVMKGNPPKLRQWIREFSSGKSIRKVFPASSSILQADEKTLRDKTLWQLKCLLGENIKLSADRIESQAPLEQYGIDSVMISQLNWKLTTIFGEISKTLFYEYQTLSDLAVYFTANHSEACLAWTGLGNTGSSQSEAIDNVPEFPGSAPLEPENKREHTFTLPQSRVHDSIAIIGMSAHFSQTDTLEAYWEILKNGKDSITEIPSERWSLEGFYHPDPDEALAQGKSYSKWGSFLEGFALFDPLFFNISPREAVSLDPHERLFLQSSWEALEDAGYTKETLEQEYQQKVGVFAGITKTGFDFYGRELWMPGESIYPRTSFSSVANRVSYTLNLRGPSMPIDTMCSSSLTAVHEACEHLHRGECELAFAGGVNLYLHPSNYIEMCAMKMLSKDRQCRSFGKGSNGFVPGEGAGVVLLKPLNRAIRDKDHIYAVIRGTGMNHGGKTNGYTVPNPVAQGELIRETLVKAGVHARSVTYVEAHGTGTELGDPVEVTGLTRAFQKDTSDTGFCSLGSAKSNMGHLEAAAGIAGLAKIILQMKHGKLVPTLHAREPNPNIDFVKTPFVLQQNLEEWKRPVIEIEGELKEFPRIAGISSFGAGGSNAHAVIEEYVETENWQPAAIPPCIVVLSAKNEERLKEYAGKLLDFVRKYAGDNLTNLAYTLQTGRQAMEERIAFIAASIEDIKSKLQNFIEGHGNAENFWRGRVRPNKNTLAVFTENEELQEAVEKWIRRGKYSKFPELWVKGLKFDWERLYKEPKPFRMSLPAYPFAKERYWVKTGKDKIERLQLHSLPHQDISLLSEQECSSTASDQEILPENHPVKGQTVYPEDDMPSQTDVTMMVPVWNAISPPGIKPPLLAKTDHLVVIGGTRDQRNAIREVYPNTRTLEIHAKDTIELLAEKLDTLTHINHVVWIAPYSPLKSIADDSIIQDQNQGVLQLFRMVKALLSLDYGLKELSWTLITTLTQAVKKKDPVNPAHAGVYGFSGSLAKEYPHWKIRLLDLEADCDWPIREMFALQADARGDAMAYRGKEWFEQALIPVRDVSGGKSLYRSEGVYVVIGGAGGIGETWTKWMIENYRAKVIWIGRSKKDKKIQAKLDALTKFGPAPAYIQADATKLESFLEAFNKIRQDHPRIHGVIHSAIVLSDKSLALMDEKRFRAGLAAKVDVSVRMAQVFQKDPPDFALFFSSMQSFVKAPGQSNYASGCTFKDAFAKMLSHEWACVVKIINWGYWGSVGIVADSFYMDRMERAGFGSIEPAEGMEALETFIKCPANQAALVKIVESNKFLNN